MQLAIRNKWVSLKGSSIVRDMNEKDVLKVEGKFWTFTRKKFVKTLDGELKYMVRNKFWKLFAYKAFVFDPNGERVAYVRRKIFSFHDRYFIETKKYGQIEIKGNILQFDYHIMVNGEEVGHVARKISLRDSYVLDLNDKYANDDIYFFVALVIAIDNITDEKNSDDAAAASSY